MSGSIRILLADRHAALREGLRVILELQDDMEVVAETADGLETLRQWRALRPDLLILDPELPGLGGAALVEQLRREDGGARVLVLTTFEDEPDVGHILEDGAVQHLLKGFTREELLAAVRAVFAIPRAARA